MPDEVYFDPSPKQTEFLKAVFSGKYRVVLFGGAIRGGKTYAGLGALIFLSLMFPGSIWAVVRDSLPTLKRTTIKSFFKACPPALIKSYNQDSQTVKFKNGSQIIFFPENYDDDKELDRWKGLEVSGFLLEECNELQEVSFWKAIERSGSFIPKSGIKKAPPIVLMTCNPASNWVKTLLYDPWSCKPDAKPFPEKWHYIPSKITDNPYVTQDVDYMESLKTLPTYQYEVFVNGNWDIQLKIGGEYFKYFELDKHVRKYARQEDAYDPDLPLHISWDDNVHPYLPCGIFQVHISDVVLENGKIDHNFEVRMIDEVAGKTPNNTVDSVCKEIIRKYPSHKSGMYIYGDATAKKEDTKLQKGYNFYTLIQDYLAQYKPQMRVIGHNPNVVPRANWMNSIMEKEIGRIKIVISEWCKTCINDFIALKEDENGGKAKLVKKDPKTLVSYQTVGHYADLFEYFMVSEFSQKFAEYQNGGAVSSIRLGKNAVSKNSY